MKLLIPIILKYCTCGDQLNSFHDSLYGTRLPQEILYIILEYYVTNRRDLILFGCICQHWRNAMLYSPLWITLRNHRLLSTESFASPYLISSQIIQDLHLQLLKGKRNQLHNQRMYQLKWYPRLFILLTTLLFFGINWENLIAYSIGFVLLYFGLLVNIYSLYFSETDYSDQILQILVSVIIMATLFLTQYKLLSSTKLLWIQTVSPLTIAYIIEYIWIYQKTKGIDLTTFFILSWVVCTPPIAALYLYCLHLDFPKFPYNSSQTLYILVFHLILIFAYYCFHVIHLVDLVSTRLPFTLTQPLSRGQYVMTAYVALILVGFGSMILFIIQFIPFTHIAALNCLNIIFYISLACSSVLGIEALSII